MPYFAMVYAKEHRNTDMLLMNRRGRGQLVDMVRGGVSWLLWLPVWFLNQTGFKFRGGDRFRMWGLPLFSK